MCVGDPFCSEYQHRLVDVENFRFVRALKPKLQPSKSIELDVCGRPFLQIWSQICIDLFIGYYYSTVYISLQLFIM